MNAPSPSPPFEAPSKRSAAGLSAATRASHLAAAGDLGRGAAQADARFTLGASDLDAWLGGGLVRAGVHEAFAASGGDQPAAVGFALAALARAAAGRSPGARALVWVRHDALEAEAGRPYGPGLADWGLDPRRLLFVRARTVADALRAAGEAARLTSLGGVLLEVWGEDKRLDLTVSRRLALRAEAAGTPVFFVRAGAAPAPSAAASRWRVRAAPSVPLSAQAPGAPAFEVEVLRRRGGSAGGPWRLEWSRDDAAFRPLAAAAPSFGAVAAVSTDRPFRDRPGEEGPARRRAS